MKSEPLSFLSIKSSHVLNGRQVLLCEIEKKVHIKNYATHVDHMCTVCKSVLNNWMQLKMQQIPKSCSFSFNWNLFIFNLIISKWYFCRHSGRELTFKDPLHRRSPMNCNMLDWLLGWSNTANNISLLSKKRELYKKKYGTKNLSPVCQCVNQMYIWLAATRGTKCSGSSGCRGLIPPLNPAGARWSSTLLGEHSAANNKLNKISLYTVQSPLHWLLLWLWLWQ